MRFTKVRDVRNPERGTARSAGIDFFVPEDLIQGGLYIHIQPNGNALIPSGIKVEVPKGYALVMFNKSGVASKFGLLVGACVIDEDYQGEVHLDLHNTSAREVVIRPGMKIAQGLLLKLHEDFSLVEAEEGELWHGEVTERGTGGFGSTNKK